MEMAGEAQRRSLNFQKNLVKYIGFHEGKSLATYIARVEKSSCIRGSQEASTSWHPMVNALIVGCYGGNGPEKPI